VTLADTLADALGVTLDGAAARALDATMGASNKATSERAVRMAVVRSS
jgi:hypothetical protein